MILSIHQPSYFPWLGLLHKVSASDLFVVMDEVQLSDSAYQHRNLFLMGDGRTKFLTIPFVKKGYKEVPIRDLRIANDGWREDHLNFLRNNYRKHPYFKVVMPQVEDLLSKPYETIFDAVMATFRMSMEWFGVRTEIRLQSELDFDRALVKGDLVLAMIKATGADTYLTGTGALGYLDQSAFHGKPALQVDVFKHPTYPQYGVAEFVPGLACIDAVFNLGPERVGDLILTQASG